MTILITGAAGFVGCKMAEYFREADSSIQLIGIDNLSRTGTESNIGNLEKYNCTFIKSDISNQIDIDSLPKVDWIIDCAANPSVLAGHNGTNSLDLINNNLTGTFYLLEKCKRDQAGFILLSTNRVYSIESLRKIPLFQNDNRFDIAENKLIPNGASTKGVNELFSTASPISLYGATKLASEVIALEYHYSFGFPVWINRCGVIAGPGQFGKIDQGIFSYWIYQYLLDKPLSFIGFGGTGFQVRDMLHPFDVFTMIQQQINTTSKDAPKIINLGGGIENTMSLLELDNYCKTTINTSKLIQSATKDRAFDIPYYSTDYSLAQQYWNWKPTISSNDILDQIVQYGQNNLEHIRAIS